MSSEAPLTRDEILGGLPAGRARTLLFLIESRVAHMAAQSQQAMNLFLTQEAERERDLVFIEAFALGREPPLRPSIQQLERYASQWASLVPDEPRLRAALAHFLSIKYRFAYRAVPGIRAALGLDTEVVQQAYQRLYGEPLATLFESQPTLAQRLRWIQSAFAHKLESLPPFWTVYSLTLTETVGGGILALPIAIARIGPLAGVALLIVLGLVNILTIAAMAESVARTGSVRYGNAFFGRLVAEYLGDAGSLILILALFVINSVSLLAFYIGFSTALADATRIPAMLWCGVLLLIGLYFLTRGSLSSTIASALVVGATNIVLILILSLLVVPHLQPGNLLYFNLPFVGGRPFDPSILELIFGVVLVAYFGHSSVGNCGKLVLRRDPSARSLIWGTVAAEATAMTIYCLWVFVVNGAIAPQVLASQTGTALAPLAAAVGPLVSVLGSAFAILAMGMVSIHVSLGLFNIIREQLPAKPRQTFILAHLQGRLVLYPRGKPDTSPRLSLTYLGSEGNQHRFCLRIQSGANTSVKNIVITSGWEEGNLFELFPDLRTSRIHFRIEVVDALQEHVRLRVITPLVVSYEQDRSASGLSMLDALAIPQSEWRLVQWLLRRGAVSLTDAANYLSQDESSAQATLNDLVKRGSVQRVQVGPATRYRAGLGRRRGRALPDHIWQALGEQPQPASSTKTGATVTQRVQDLVLSEAGRFVLSLSPVVIIFLLTEWLLFTHTESFTRVMNLGGVIAASIFAGIFPVLLLMSSRRKGDMVPQVVYRILGHPAVLAVIYLTFLSAIFVHGLVIWQDPLQRAVAVLCGLAVVGMTIATARRGAFNSRAVVELRQDANETQARFNVIVGGQPAPARVRFESSAGETNCQAASGPAPHVSELRRATFELSGAQAQELKVWAHQITPEGNSESMPAKLELHMRDEMNQYDLKLLGGQVVRPMTAQDCWLDIKLDESC